MGLGALQRTQDHLVLRQSFFKDSVVKHLASTMSLDVQPVLDNNPFVEVKELVHGGVLYDLRTFSSLIFSRASFSLSYPNIAA